MPIAEKHLRCPLDSLVCILIAPGRSRSDTRYQEHRNPFKEIIRGQLVPAWGTKHIFSQPWTSLQSQKYLCNVCPSHMYTSFSWNHAANWLLPPSYHCILALPPRSWRCGHSATHEPFGNTLCWLPACYRIRILHKMMESEGFIIFF